MNAWKSKVIACFALAVLGLAPAVAAPPVTVSLATPPSAEQGTIALDVVVNGNGFNASARVDYFVTGTNNAGGITVRKVVFRSPKELVTTIDVAETADLANFDIQVMLDDGRKGKGTSLFKVTVKPGNGPNNPPARTYPEGRYWHALASNGETTAAASRLYMIGGQNYGMPAPEGLWSYANAGSTDARWTLVPPGTTSPGRVFHNGWSCGGGHCVLVNGYDGLSTSKDTWVFSEVTQTWAKVNCTDRKRPRGVLCPSERRLPVMAYDPVRGVHMLFGGDGSNVALDDMFLFDAVAMKWTQVQGIAVPPARFAAAAAFVPGAGIFVHGGWDYTWIDGDSTRNDAYLWDGVAWAPVESIMSNPAGVAPKLSMHSMAWDESRGSVIVASGVARSDHLPNDKTWYVKLTRPAGNWLATWTQAYPACQSAVSSPPDAVVHAEARMAFDAAAGVQVFFGGINEQASDLAAYDNTVECY